MLALGWVKALHEGVDGRDSMRPVLAITMGDVNGVGPEVLAKALAQ